MAYIERTNGEVIYALERWVAGHPWPNEVWNVVDGVEWTPREFLEMVKKGGSFSNVLLGFIVAQARRLNEDPLDYIGRMIRESVITEEDRFSTV